MPIIKKKEQIKIGGDNDIPDNDSLIYLTNECKYRLPNIGPFECYYSYNEGLFIDVQDLGEGRGYYNFYNSEVGNLILYDTTTKDAKYINVYDEWHDEETFSDRRYFYIDTDNSIQIFGVNFGETETQFFKTYKITVKENGELEIKGNKIK